MSDTTIRTAVAAWLSGAAAAETTYGHISKWDTSGVTDMSELFEYASSFNEDISAWDTSGVTRMDYMFYYASAFNQDLGDWAVDSHPRACSGCSWGPRPSTRTSAGAWTTT